MKVYLLNNADKDVDCNPYPIAVFLTYEDAKAALDIVKADDLKRYGCTWTPLSITEVETGKWSIGRWGYLNNLSDGGKEL